jgi:hypothetical protein
MSCGAGLFVNDDNECEKKRVAPRRPEATQVIVRRSQEPPPPATAARPAPTAQPLYRAARCPTGSIMSGIPCN